MLSPFIPMKASWTSQPFKLSEKFNCTWTQWEDMETLHSFIQFMDWEVFQKDSQELVQSTEEHLCWTLISIKFFSKMERLLESRALMVSLTAQRLFAIQLTHWNVALNKESNLLRKLSDAFVFWTTQSRELRTFHQSKSSFLKDKFKERMVHFDLIQDIYIMMVSSVHCVSKKDTYIAIISTVVETDKPEK